MKRHPLLVLSVAAVAVLGACGGDDGDANTADPGTADTVSIDDLFDPAPLEQYVGSPLSEFTTQAEALGAEVRVVERDGESLAVTMDLRPNRVNVAVEGPDEIVTRIVDVG
jgi:hypothetical protein